MTTQRGRILIAGVIPGSIDFPDAMRNRVGSVDEIKAKLEADFARIRRNGFEYKVHQIDPADVEGGLKVLEDELRSAKYDGFVIGAGARLVPQATVLFEKIVNVYRSVAPHIPIMFNDGPDTHCAALERTFGVKMGE